MTQTENTIPFDTLAKINEDGSMYKFLAAPLLLVLAVGVVIVVLKLVQGRREKMSTDRLLKE